MENFETNEINISLAELREEIIQTNYYILEGVKEGNKQKVMKYKIMLDNLIKIYLNK